MIRSLHIEHYALIDQLDINLQPGFSVLTGETGAGKSIILGAINLLLGGRADHSAIRAGERRCVIEAEFDTSGMDLSDFFTTADLDYDGQLCILRRELTAGGKSRAFINDTPVSLSTIKQLGDQLIDIHSQHQSLLLAAANYQLATIDAIGQTQAALETYTQLYNHYTDACRQLEEARRDYESAVNEEDYLRFQSEQIGDAQLHPDEQAELEAEQQVLSHAEEIKNALYTAASALTTDNDNSALSLVRQAENAIKSIAAHHQPSSAMATRIESCRIELQDIYEEITSQADSLDFDPRRQTYVDERLATIYTLQKKHHCTSIDELLTLKAELDRRLAAIDQSDEHLTQLEAARDDAYDHLMAQAEIISAMRHKTKTQIEATTTDMLKALGMPHATFNIVMGRLPEPGNRGVDTATFLFSANKNIPPQPLSQTASGGEMSRVMLAIKAQTAGARQLPTIILDEIDTGVSGNIADKMATIMADMAQGGRQVISITHLPQIAARATEHYKVYKTDELFRTTTHITHLSTEKRIDEIAHMLSGATITQAARSNAAELLRTN
ncbi:MAG: DNA repair protein RecN [Bacteroidaceae bacterium]|nr:DNA repair protein RecN [Bacteroidaceae bacterium]